MSFCMCGQSSRVFCPYRENFHFSFIFSCLLVFLEHAGRPLMTLTYAVLSCIISHLHEICFSGAADHSPVFFLPFPAAYISVAREKGRKCVRGWSNYCRFPCLCSSYFFFFNSFYSNGKFCGESSLYKIEMKMNSYIYRIGI